MSLEILQAKSELKELVDTFSIWNHSLNKNWYKKGTPKEAVLIA
jgi:hypothetical protein